MLNKLATEFALNGIKDTLSLQDLASGLLKGEKPLLPINFVTIFSGCAVEEEEVVGTGSFAGRLVWQSGRGNSRRPTADKLSYGQYFEANARILNLLELEPKAHVEYLDFLRQIGILLQTFTIAPVFTLDHLHRLYIHETKSQWNIIENSLENSVLKKKEDFTRQNNVSSSSSNRRSDSRGARSAVSPTSPKQIGPDAVCWLYNLPKGCFWGEKCIYPHVCSVDHCRQNHPACRHAECVQARNPPGPKQIV